MYLKDLTKLNGISGNEDEVRDYIKNNIINFADELKTDRLGNLIAYKRGNGRKLKVMLSAHMDEVGFMVTGHGKDGSVRFKPVGGIDERILPGKEVFIGPERIPGVIAIKPIHLQDKDTRNVNVKLKNLYIDIGADKKEEAEKAAPLGEFICFSDEYQEMGDSVVKAKALDDRVGCAILMDMAKEKYNFDLYLCFTVQEEIGLRGSETAAYQVAPDIALAVEGTTCSDVPEVEEQDYSTRLGEGAALTIMDRTAYADKRLTSFIYKLAQDKGLKVQYKQTTTGGNDAGKIQRSREGVITAAISVPCRYIHSPVSMMDKRDYESCKEIVRALLREIDTRQDFLDYIKNGGNFDV